MISLLVSEYIPMPGLPPEPDPRDESAGAKFLRPGGIWLEENWGMRGIEPPLQRRQPINIPNGSLTFLTCHRNPNPNCRKIILKCNEFMHLLAVSFYEFEKPSAEALGERAAVATCLYATMDAAMRVPKIFET